MFPSLGRRCLVAAAQVLSRRYFLNNFIRALPEQSSISPFLRHTNYSTSRTIPITGVSNNTSTTNPKTYSEEEINKFRSLGHDWWHPNGSFKLLHSMNDLRVPFIRDGIIQTGAATALGQLEGPKPLSNVNILDVGCGGGILSEPLARLGANVTGIDATEEGIAAAITHSKLDSKLGNNLSYHCCTIEQHSSEHAEKYDAVVISEVLEHVPSIEVFLNECCKCLNPGGSLFVTTINRTTRSYLGAIVAAECILGIVPKGTHDWNKFVKIDELTKILKENELNVRLLHGLLCLPPVNRWCWIEDTSVNYALQAVKPSIQI